MMADFKQQRALRIPLVGVLTDFAPHLYWVHETVDVYVVPSEEAKQRFVAKGIQSDRIRVYGIPVEPRFLDPVDRAATYAQFHLEPTKPVILVMGGGGGFGPIRELMRSLDEVPQPCQFVVLTGTNDALLSWFRHQQFRHPVFANGYVEAVPELMEIATLLITKPGGLTTAEALAKHLPMLIVTPIPGQELCNARHLLAQGAAVQLSSPETAKDVMAQLLRDARQLDRLREHAARMAHPDSALKTAQLLLELAG
jgi:processive 1,2-diacylglycerol beta-glucosyltransferase